MDDISCDICGDSQNERFTINLKCNHCFHSTCLDKWLENHITCPTCRQDITENRNNEESSNRNTTSLNNETMI